MQVSVRTLSFLDEWLVKDIMEKYRYDADTALDKYLFSETYQLVNDYENGLYLLSPEAIFDMWECEQVTGDPKNSVYF